MTGDMALIDILEEAVCSSLGLPVGQVNSDVDRYRLNQDDVWSGIELVRGQRIGEFGG